MTAFRQALAACGLSAREAATFLDVRNDTVLSWSSGRRTPPPGAWQALANLYARMEDAADAAIDLIDEHDPDQIELDATGLHGAWPCPGTADAVKAMIFLRLAVSDP